MKWEEKTDGINKEFEMWQDELDKRTMHLKMTVTFDTDKIEGIEEVIESLKEEVILRSPNKKIDISNSFP